MGVLIAAAAGVFQHKLMRDQSSKEIGNHGDIQPAQPDDQEDKAYAAWKEEGRRRLGPDAERNLDLGKEDEDANVQMVLDATGATETTADVDKHNPPSLSEKQHGSAAISKAGWGGIFSRCDSSPSTLSIWCESATKNTGCWENNTDCERVRAWTGLCLPAHANACSTHMWSSCKTELDKTGVVPCFWSFLKTVQDWCEDNSFKEAAGKWYRYNKKTGRQLRHGTLIDKSNESLEKSLTDEAQPSQQETLEESLAGKRASRDERDTRSC